MELACRLYHGNRPDAPSEVTSHPHVEIVSSGEKENWKLKVLADQLRAFGGIPFSYQEMESTGGTIHGARIRIALCERECNAGGVGANPAASGK